MSVVWLQKCGICLFVVVVCFLFGLLNNDCVCGTNVVCPCWLLRPSLIGAAYNLYLLPGHIDLIMASCRLP